MAPPPDPLPPRTVVAGAALAALAVPARFAILNHLMAAGPRTASQCADVVGETASNCSWHLRALAEVGLVERAEPSGTDGRVRPWRAAVVGIELPDDVGPAGAVARAALSGAAVQQADALFRRYLARRELLPPEWTQVGGENDYSLLLSPAELESLVAAVDILVRPYVRPIRGDDAPDGSAVVRLTLRTFLDPDVHRTQQPPPDLPAEP